ncbi:hypothetical protein TNCV_80391 [Trichonephila clavipes]|nr:hypothetical protein TNCV_80391 [Trichonephila clavipes]
MTQEVEKTSQTLCEKRATGCKFLMRKSHLNVSFLCEDYVMSHIGRKHSYQHESVFDSGRIMAHRELGLSFCNIATHLGHCLANIKFHEFKRVTLNLNAIQDKTDSFNLHQR